MPNKKLLKQMEIFNKISSHELSPDEYYLLCCIKESTTPLYINLNLNMRTLKIKGFLNEDNEISSDGVLLIQSVERLFTVQKKKTSLQILGDDYKEKIKAYRELFPNKKLPSGKAARSNPSNCENAFRWFFLNNDYNWETILQATANYVWEFEQNNYKYMRTAQYFIRKQEADRTFSSDLADYCDAIITGTDLQDDAKFKSKVV